MTDDHDDNIRPISEFPGHAETGQAMADHVAAASFPRIAAASVLVAAIRIALVWNGRAWLEEKLRNILADLPEIEAELRSEDLRRKH